jgi:hypothetical protein
VLTGSSALLAEAAHSVADTGTRACCARRCRWAIGAGRAASVR